MLRQELRIFEKKWDNIATVLIQYCWTFVLDSNNIYREYIMTNEEFYEDLNATDCRNIIYVYKEKNSGMVGRL